MASVGLEPTQAADDQRGEIPGARGIQLESVQAGRDAKEDAENDCRRC